METGLRRVLIFDTTLRDGEQAPGATMTAGEKFIVAQQLERLGVDVMEAGFPVASEGEFVAVREIARKIRGVQVAAIARARHEDIDRAWEALREAADPRLHIFISTSDIHLRYQLGKRRDEVLKQAADAVRRASAYTSNVEFSAMDATRTDREFLRRVLEEAILAGARTVNIADTVGYAVPDEFGDLVAYLIAHVAGLDGAKLSVHCHDDLGLAVANSLAAIRHGADQVKCTLNGMGERAGNAALEEVVMALEVRKEFFRCRTNVHTEQLRESSRLLTEVTGIPVQPHKAIVGANAFAHESGVHQDGLMKERTTYEIIEPRSVGEIGTRMVLGKHSGRRALGEHLKKIGRPLVPSEMDRFFPIFKEWADNRKMISDADLEALLACLPASSSSLG
jgi:2-isopropylmalate synthase